MKLPPERSKIRKDAGAVYYWVGNAYVFLSGQAGTNVIVQKCYSDMTNEKLILEEGDEVNFYEYQSTSHEYLMQGIDPEWFTLMALGDKRLPVLVKSADLSNLNLSYIHVTATKDRQRIRTMISGYLSLKDLL